MLKNDNQKLNDNNKENKNKINSIINELNDLNINRTSILSELKIKDDLIMKYDNKINILEEEINQLKLRNDKKEINEEKYFTEMTLNDKEKEKKIIKEQLINEPEKNEYIDLKEEILNLKEIKNEKIKLYKNNSFVNEDKKI